MHVERRPLAEDVAVLHGQERHAAGQHLLQHAADRARQRDAGRRGRTGHAVGRSNAVAAGQQLRPERDAGRSPQRKPLRDGFTADDAGRCDAVLRSRAFLRGDARFVRSRDPRGRNAEPLRRRVRGR